MFGNGSIAHDVYFMHPGHLGQWEESGRDQGHSTMCMSLGGDLLEMAWNHDDLYGLYNNRFLAAAEYVARSNVLDENGNTYPMPYAREQDPERLGADLQPLCESHGPGGAQRRTHGAAVRAELLVQRW